mmetsp:Transcript_39583/g.100398  ORF Transcript_39583/g.100398 Transcript_39583/m.100398 type:complete len:266 (-) Transcript_39583:28-825(-)
MPNQQNHTQSPVHQHPRPPSGRPKMGNRRSQCRPSTHLLPTTMLPPQLRFKHCKPDAVRIVGFDWDPATETISPSTDPRAVQKMQIIEFKYCTDLNHATVHALIREKYQHMESALRQQGWQCPIEIIPVTLSRSGTIHKHTLEAIHSLTVLWPKKQPPDNPLHLPAPLQSASVGNSKDTQSDGYILSSAYPDSPSNLQCPTLVPPTNPACKPTVNIHASVDHCTQHPRYGRGGQYQAAWKVKGRGRKGGRPEAASGIPRVPTVVG